MGKKGVSRLSGNTHPIVGEKNIYKVVGWYPDTPTADRNPKKVTWELFKKRKNGNFTTTNIKKVGASDFTFGEMAAGETYRLESYLHAPEGGGLLITPQPSKIPKINKVDLLYVDDTNGKVFSFMEKLRAKANCTNLFNKELVFTLWEDDAKNEGHNAKNKVIETKKARINKNGIAIVEFLLTKALMKKAMEGEADVNQLEFYVTVEYYKHKKHATENVNIDNPNPKVPISPPKKPVSPKEQPKAKGSPAEQKGKSKKEEKGILETISEKWEGLWDWWEGEGTVKKEQKPTVQKPTEKSPAAVEKVPNQTDRTCICKEQYKDLVWGEKVSCEFRKKVVQICGELWGESRKMEMASGLMAVMNVETRGSFKAQQLEGWKSVKDPKEMKIDDFWKEGNRKSSRAIGLIQFTQDALQNALQEYKSNPKLSTEEKFDELNKLKLSYAQMGEIKQLDKVKKYFEGQKNNIKSPEDIYLAVFAPTGVGKSDSYVLYQKYDNPSTNPEKTSTKNYNANSSVDTGSKGNTKSDGKIQRSEILERFHDSMKQGKKNLAENFSCNKDENKTEENKDNKWHDPVDNPQLCLYTQNGNYRPRYNVFGRVRKERENPKHQGIDFLALPGSNVYACVDAYIEFIEIQGGYGNVVCLKVKDKEGFIKRKRKFDLQYSSQGEILEGNGFSYNGDYYLFYAHLQKVNISMNNKEVKCGDVIALNGTSGYGSTKDPHLHFEIRNNARASGLNSRCHPGIFVYYKGENDMSQAEKDYHKKIAEKFWN